MIRALIVDDEAPARLRMHDLLRGQPGFEVVGECGDAGEALAAVDALKPDLVFLDIAMPGISGLELGKRLHEQGAAYIIFTTGHGEHALEAFELGAVDYLKKPFDRARLDAALQKVRERLPGRRDRATTDMAQLLAGLGALNDSLGSGGRMAVKDGTRIKFLDRGGIAYVKADGDYLHVYDGGSQERTMIRERITNLEKRLAGLHFVRISRSVLVNMDYVKEMKPNRRGDYLFVMRDGEQFPSGPTYREAVRRLLSEVRQG